jgi:hypothetical protein
MCGGEMASLNTLGFVIIRHVSSKVTDFYWKESYTSIRRFYPLAPILIVDDSSNREFLREDIHTTNCTVIYDTENKGRAELLPYYYFHKLKPFSKAIIIHDSVFLHAPLDLSASEGSCPGIQFLWSIPHYYDDTIQTEIHELIGALPSSCREDVRSMYYHTKSDWTGIFGMMSIVDWAWLNDVEQRYHLFENWFPVLKNREYRCGMERVFGLVAYHHGKEHVLPPLFGNTQQYPLWGITFVQYLHYYESISAYSIIKVWSGR